jgi:hypothetical protein
MKLIENWRHAWRLWSVRLASATARVKIDKLIVIGPKAMIHVDRPHGGKLCDCQSATISRPH